MSPDLSTSPPLQETPYVFQRLERVKEHLYADALQYSLDASQRAWYLRTTAEYLAEHLLETYRRRVEEASHVTGLDVLASPIRPYLTVITDPHGHFTIQIDLDASTTEASSLSSRRALEPVTKTRHGRNSPAAGH